MCPDDKDKISSRVRYDLDNPIISIRVSKGEYEKLNNLRKGGTVGWKDLLLRSLEDKKDQRLLVGECSKCKAKYPFDMTDPASKKSLDQLVSKGMPVCRKCKYQKKKGPLGWFRR